MTFGAIGLDLCGLPTHLFSDADTQDFLCTWTDAEVCTFFSNC